MRGFVPLPPIEFVVGNKRVVVNRHRGVGRFYFVDTILVDSDTIYPPKCDAPVLPTSGLFSSSHIELRSVLGKGKDLMLVETHDGKKQRDLLFAAVFEGSPECGAYGYWLLRVGPTGTRATAPIVGCMTDPYTENTETEGEYFKESRNPIIQWGPPVSVRISDGLGSWLQFQLNSWTLDWTQISGQPVKNNNNLP